MTDGDRGPKSPVAHAMPRPYRRPATRFLRLQAAGAASDGVLRRSMSTLSVRLLSAYPKRQGRS